MKRVIFALEMPHGSSYIGGIANIINQYMSNQSLFENNDFEIEVFDETIVNASCDFLPRKILNIINAFRQRLYLSKYVKKNRDAIIHIHTSIGWTLLKDLFIISKIRKKTKQKIVVSIHFAELNKILSPSRLIRTYELSVLKKCVDEIVFLSHETQKEFINAGIEKSKTSVLYTFHNFDNDIIKSNMSSSEGSLKLLFVGSIDKRKGILDLLDVMKEVSEEKVTLDICGQVNDESIRHEYESKVNELTNRVIEHGYVKGKEKKEIFEKCDILVLPSYGEGMPIVIMEAMATGNAIISTRVGSIPEIVQSENGFLIKPGDKIALKESILALLMDKEKLIEIKEKNYKKGMEFGLIGNISGLCSIYIKDEK